MAEEEKLKLTTVTEARDKLKIVADQVKNAKKQLSRIIKERESTRAKVAKITSDIKSLKNKWKLN